MKLWLALLVYLFFLSGSGFFLGAPAVSQQEFDEAVLTEAGFRKLQSVHATVWTDFPAGSEVENYPAWLDQGVSQWSDYFQVEKEQASQWRVTAFVMQRTEKFQAVKAWPEGVAEFPAGYNVGNHLWVVEQPTRYFTRHLFFHEATHAFMQNFLGGSGPAWYSEGMAERFGLHTIDDDGNLVTGFRPRLSEQVDGWGRVKVIREMLAESKRLTLSEVTRIGTIRFDDLAGYSWSWAACEFLATHPLSQQKFRGMQNAAKNRSLGFSVRLRQVLESSWVELERDWAIYIDEIDYGMTATSSAITAADRDATPAGIRLAANRSWQTTGMTVHSAQTLRISATGKFIVASNQTPPWTCTAGGITIDYYRGLPVGILMAAVIGEDGVLGDEQPVGIGREIRFTRAGKLVLRVNENPARMMDNTGELLVKIVPAG